MSLNTCIKVSLSAKRKCNVSREILRAAADRISGFTNNEIAWQTPPSEIEKKNEKCYGYSIQ